MQGPMDVKVSYMDSYIMLHGHLELVSKNHLLEEG